MNFFSPYSLFATVIGLVTSVLSVFIAAHIVRYVFRDVINKYLNK